MEPLKILSSRNVKVVYAIEIYNLHSFTSFTYHTFTKKAALRMANCYILDHAVHIRKLNKDEYVVSTFKHIVNMEEENA